MNILGQKEGVTPGYPGGLDVLFKEDKPLLGKSW